MYVCMSVFIRTYVKQKRIKPYVRLHGFPNLRVISPCEFGVGALFMDTFACTYFNDFLLCVCLSLSLLLSPMFKWDLFILCELILWYVYELQWLFTKRLLTVELRGQIQRINTFLKNIYHVKYCPIHPSNSGTPAQKL